MKNIFIGALILAGGIAVREVGAAEPLASFASAIAQGDALYAQRADFSANKAALAAYERAVVMDPSSSEAHWKAARAAWWAGTCLKEDRSAIPYFQKGIDYGENSVRLDPKSAETHFWLGSNYGSFGYVKGALTSLRLIKSIRKEMNKVNEINPGYISGGADRVLGILDYKVPGLVGGDKKQSRVELERSFASDPTFPVTMYYLAEYWDVMGKKETARTYLKKLNELPVKDDDKPEFAVIQDKVRDLTKKLIP